MNVSSGPTRSFAESKKRRYKRPFDLWVMIVAHATLLPFWMLLWILIPLLVWLEDRGPVFYSQRRVGKHGRYFILLKFRTMVPNSDSEGPAWTTAGDLRVTRVGKILRRTALDELPGLLSIWKGDMSLVGPRALNVEEQLKLEKEVMGFKDRLQVLPGLTGLAQVHDKFDLGQDKLRYDLEYIERMSAWLDISLLLVSVKNTLLARWDNRMGKLTDSKSRPGKDTDLVSGSFKQESKRNKL